MEVKHLNSNPSQNNKGIKMFAQTSRGDSIEWSFSVKGESFSVGNDTSCTWYVKGGENEGCFFTLEYDGQRLILRPQVEVKTTKKTLSKAVYLNNKSTVFVGALGFKICIEEIVLLEEDDESEHEATRVANFGDEQNLLNVSNENQSVERKQQERSYALTPPRLPKKKAVYEDSVDMGDSTVVADANDIYNIAKSIEAESPGADTSSASQRDDAKEKQIGKKGNTPKEEKFSKSLFTLPADSRKQTMTVDELTVEPKQNRRRKKILLIALTVFSVVVFGVLMKKNKEDELRKIKLAELQAAKIKGPDDLPPVVNKQVPPIVVIQSNSDQKAEVQEKRASEHLIAGRLLDAQKELKELSSKYPKDGRYLYALNLVKTKIAARCSDSIYASDPLCLGTQQ